MFYLAFKLVFEQWERLSINLLTPIIMEKNKQTIQLIQLTPTELINAFENSVNIKLEELKNSFQPKEPEELMTRSETSLLLKVNLTTLWNWTKQGKLKSYGIGNRVYYKRHEVMQSIINLKN